MLIGPLLAVLLIVLASAAAVVVKWFELGRARDTFVAVARAIVRRTKWLFGWSSRSLR